VLSHVSEVVGSAGAGISPKLSSFWRYGFVHFQDLEFKWFVVILEKLWEITLAVSISRISKRDLFWVRFNDDPV
jgi:hypothetical protein